jgi:release factor glutamine methyltransferase
MTVEELRRKFLSSSSETRIAPEDFYVLLSHVTGKSREFLLAHPEYELDAEAETQTRAYFTRRIAHEPISYIIGKKEFYGRDFLVTPDTLIPRPETELLVELALGKIESRKGKILIADIGTGSGAIIIALASELKKRNTKYGIRNTKYDFHATDISSAALNIAKKNAEHHSIANEISFHEGNLILPIEKYFDDVDEIVLLANLPYLSELLYKSTRLDVHDYEPQSALESGYDGLDHYRALFQIMHTQGLSEKKCSVFCEISPEQSTAIRKIFQLIFPGAKSDTYQDLSSHDRVAFFRMNEG